MYRVLEDLCTPQKPSDKSLEEITQLLLKHFKSNLVVADSFKFYNAKQEGESISNFLVHLKHLASTCEFGSFLKIALHDKFVCGLKDNRIQEKLLSEDKSREEAVKMAKAMELATANVAHIKEKEMDEVNKVCAESNTFELQKKYEIKKCVLGAVENGMRDTHSVPHGERHVLNAAIKTIFPDIVKMNNGETCRITYKRYDILLLSTRYSNYKPYTCKLELYGIQCEMEIDTGCSSTLISKKQFDLLPYTRL